MIRRPQKMPTDSEQIPLRGLISEVDGKCLIGRWYENGVRIGYPQFHTQLPRKDSFPL